MKLTFNFSIIIICFSLLHIGCGSSDEGKTVVNINVDQDAPNAADGFDLEQFHKLLIEEQPASGEWDAKFLSDLVNREDINNLDLNLDGVVDQVFVEPFGGGDNMGFDLYTKPDENSEQSICTVVVEQESDNKGSLSVAGNEQVYGHNHYYHSGGLSNFLLMYWLFSPRYPIGGFYGGGWYRGGDYGNRRAVSSTQYQDKINNRNSNHTGTKAPSDSRTNTKPAAVTKAARTQKVANTGIRSKLTNPTRSQRQFATTQARKSSGSGFSNKNKTGKASRTPTGKSSGRSFGK